MGKGKGSAFQRNKNILNERLDEGLDVRYVAMSARRKQNLEEIDEDDFATPATSRRKRKVRKKIAQRSRRKNRKKKRKKKPR